MTKISTPEKATVDDIELPLIDKWDRLGTYQYSRSDSARPVYSIDTPPPTVSGSLHVGHVFSYTHTDLVARFKRMTGHNVFYPMGWDDNGLPTERRVQNYFGVRPDLSKQYDPDFTPPFEGTDGKSIKAADQVPISRQNFIELCMQLSAQDEEKFRELWTRLGVSVDWRYTYQTIGERARRIAQKAFLRNLARGEAYQQEAPGLWDVTFQTAVAQAELEAREYPGFYHKLAFTSEGKEIVIETTRPELLISCVALIAHPDDARYAPLFGKTAKSPLFDVEVPVLPHTAAQMDKGSGIVMCCTFGDQTDIEWWREFNLPLRSVMSKNGRLNTEEVDWVDSARGKELGAQLNGKTPFSAREIMVEALKNDGSLLGEPEKTMRMTNFYEKGDKPLEIVTSRQWYLKNGGKDSALNAELLTRGSELNFIPDHMRTRYNNWVSGLNNDWLVSRQRFFGVAFPLWYPLDAQGNPDFKNPLTPPESALPIDPTIDVPPGFSGEQRGVAGGFTAEVDVMDTWATSSLTPQIACGWDEQGDENSTSASDFARLFPMSLRPQGQDIIRTWLFSTVVRAHLEHGQLPWQNAAISGWILDPDRKKMSKSKGNVVTPLHLLEQYGSDAVRYWASGAKLGTDATFDEGQMKIGRRLAMKVLNVTKFVLNMLPEDFDFTTDASLEKVQTEVDKSMLAALSNVVAETTKHFENYDHANALEVSERFFWEFCDDYVELVKQRAYNQTGEDGVAAFSAEESLSAKIALVRAVDVLLRLLAPFVPFAADEAWSWYKDGSVHTAIWPSADEFTAVANSAEGLWQATTSALIALRRVKSEAKVSMRIPLRLATLSVPASLLDVITHAEKDLRGTLNIVGALTFTASGSTSADEITVVEHELIQQDA
jgi:valyl-tRNA synthetase